MTITTTRTMTTTTLRLLSIGREDGCWRGDARISQRSRWQVLAGFTSRQPARNGPPGCIHLVMHLPARSRGSSPWAESQAVRASKYSTTTLCCGNPLREEGFRRCDGKT